VPSVIDEEVDVAGNELAPGAVQPHDDKGTPLVRDPQTGSLFNPMTNEKIDHKAPRFSAAGEQLDPFNRPLPPKAQPMYNEKGLPIGVGPDGRHYTPDGEEVDKNAPHFDASGKALSQDVVLAADEVAPTVSVAVKVRAALKSDTSAPEFIDPLGRSFKSHGDQDSVTLDGEVVPTTARRVEVGGKLVTYEEAKKLETVETAEPQAQKGNLTIKFENDDGEVDLGTVEVDGSTTLANVRTIIGPKTGVPDFVFLAEGVPLSKWEEKSKLAIKYQEISIRGKELKSEKPAQTFTTSAAAFAAEEEKKQQEQSEFNDIMNRVRNKTFLHHVGRDLTK
jgi:hypothetical protein